MIGGQVDVMADGPPGMQGAITLGDHRFGRVDRRHPIGPVRWGFHDLFWVHDGAVRLVFPDQGAALTLVAPAGVLILPGTLFHGAAEGGFATASICHFTQGGWAGTPGWMLPAPDEALAVQTMLRLAMTLARQPADEARRTRLLLAILDSFAPRPAPKGNGPDDRLAQAWQQAARTLDRVRTLADVAALLGLSESTFRALHRAAMQTPAGEHLRDLRLTRAEELIVTTDLPLSDIARAVGYRHAATLGSAFRARRGKTPGQYRRWSNPFA